MIKMIKGIYAHEEDGIVVDKTPDSEPFTLSKTEEAELVDKGCAVYIEVPGKSRKKPAAAAGEAAGEP
jgi:hypothetical protein